MNLQAMCTPLKISLVLGLVVFVLCGLSGQSGNLYYFKTKSGEEFRSMQVLSGDDQDYINVVPFGREGEVLLPKSEVVEFTHEASIIGKDYHVIKEPQPVNEDLIMKSKRGYIGMLMGLALPLGSFGERGSGNARTGFQFKVLHFGYRFNDTFGVGINYLSGFHQLQIGGFEPWRYNGAFLGPVLHLPLTYNANFEIKPMVGFTQTTLGDGTTTIGTYNVAYSFNTLFRINLTRKICSHIGWSYFYSSPKFSQVNLAVPIQVYSLDLGFGFNIL